MSEPSIDHGDAMAGLASRHARPHLAWSTLHPDLTASKEIREVSSPKRSALKILFANKFFFLNGGSEAVMFDEMQLMRKYELDVIEFSMRDPRNFPSKY